jgi:phosphatidylglycerophosphate synthase
VTILEETPQPGEPGAPSRCRHQAANLLSAFRFVLAAAWLAAFAADARAVVLFGSFAVTAAATDFLDGRIARRFGTVSRTGQWLDSLADISFVLTALGCEAYAGNLPAYIPALVALSFAQYAVDWVVIESSGAPIGSRLGHLGGMINYALAIVLAVAPPPALAGVWIEAAAPALALFYIVAMAERALGYRQRISVLRRKSSV